MSTDNQDSIQESPFNENKAMYSLTEQELFQENPIGFTTVNKPIIITPREFIILQHFFEIFEGPLAIFNSIKDRGFQEQTLVPYYPSDVNEDKTFKEEFLTKHNIPTKNPE